MQDQNQLSDLINVDYTGLSVQRVRVSVSTASIYSSLSCLPQTENIRLNRSESFPLSLSSGLRWPPSSLWRSSWESPAATTRLCRGSRPSWWSLCTHSSTWWPVLQVHMHTTYRPVLCSIMTCFPQYLQTEFTCLSFNWWHKVVLVTCCCSVKEIEKMSTSAGQTCENRWSSSFYCCFQ